MNGRTFAGRGRSAGIALVTVSLLLLAGCAEEAPPGGVTVEGLRPLERHDGNTLSEPALLRTQLPADALAYLRLPSLWGLVSTPKGSSLDAALASQAHVEAVASLRNALTENVFGPDLLDVPGLALLAEHQRGPLELVLLPTAAGGLPVPLSVVATTLDLDSIEAANELLDTLVAGNPQVVVQRAMSATEPAMLTFGPMAGFVEFDPATGRLRLATSLAMNDQVFAETLARFSETQQHPMHDLEARIDASGQALFAWFNVAQAVETGRQYAGAQLAQLEQYGLADIGALAFGFGVSDGKGRASLLLEMPETGLRQLMWSAANDIRLQAAGEPEAFWLMSLPDAAQLEQILAKIGELYDAHADVEELRQGVRELLGVSLEDLVATFGPELVYFEDAAGIFMALRVRDAQRQRELIDTIVEHRGLAYERREIDGRTHHHLVVPGFVPAPGEEEDQQPPSPWLTLYSRMSTHLYWIEEDDYLVFADVPQPLLDRDHIVERVAFADWLDRQRLELDHSLLAGGLTTRDLPRIVYYSYLSGLNLLGDITNQPLDLYALPTALEAGLPELGSYAFQLDASERLLGLTLTYENNPAEVLVAGNSMAGVAVVGILAAIAIPAYQDYTVRAQVAEGLNRAAVVKAAVAERYADEGRLPRDLAELGLPGDPTGEGGGYAAAIDVVNGAIVIIYGNEAGPALQGGTLTLTPWVAANGELVWVCGNAAPGPGLQPLSEGAPPSDLEDKHLPQACRP